MKVQQYDRVILKNGFEASIVEILEEGKAFLGDIDRNGDTDTEEIRIGEIQKVQSFHERTSAKIINIEELPDDISKVDKDVNIVLNYKDDMDNENFWECDRNIDEIIQNISEYILKQPIGTEMSIRTILEKIYGYLGYQWIYYDERNDWIYSRKSDNACLIAESDLQKVLEEVKKVINRNKIELDFSKWENMYVGLPYNLEFFIRFNG